MNQYIFEYFGSNMLWYKITDILGIVSIIIALGFAGLGFYQLLKRKSIRKVDSRIMLLGVFYLIVILFYVFFEVVIINYRPILLSMELEASYPSSHTMLVICIMVTAILQFHHYLDKKKGWLLTVDFISVLIILITVIGRLLSGAHWFTDIAAAILLSATLIMLYYSVLKYTE